MYRSSRPEVFCKKGVLRNFAKFTCARVSKIILEIILYKNFFIRTQRLFNNSYTKIIPYVHYYYNFRFVVYFVH